MHRRSILIIAPDLAELDLPQKTIEIAAIKRHHDTNVLTGVVRDVDIASAVSDAEYNVIWLITHADQHGILLSDGYLTAEALIQYVKATGAGLCVLNTCDNEAVALQVAAYSGSDVICTIGAVENRDALRLGQLLAGELSLYDYREAYDIVATPEGNYRYYEAGDVLRGSYRSTDEYNQLLKLYYRLEAEMRLQRGINVAIVAGVLINSYLLLFYGR